MFRMPRSIFVAALLLAAVIPAAQAAVYIPTKLTDSADGACTTDCSLREAILAANASAGPDVVLLGPGTYTLSLSGAFENQAATGDLDIHDDLTIAGRDAANTVISGAQLDRVFDVLAGVRLELLGLTVRGGQTIDEPGGGIRNAGELFLDSVLVTANEVRSDVGGGIAGRGESSVVSVVRSTVWGNTAADDGGGIHAQGVVDVINSTISDNVSQNGFGGGLYATDDAHGTISNATITDNSAGQKGGGVFVESAPFISVVHPAFKNTIIAGNHGASEVDCSGSALSNGRNLLGDGSGCLDFGPAHSDLEGTAGAPLDAGLLDLDNAGGSTPVHVPIVPSSPAIDHGSGCEPIDQRGAARAAGACEIGAVEISDQCINGGTSLCLRASRFRVKVSWTVPQSGSGSGFAVPLTDESGYFWFFDPSNAELTMKVLDGCGVNGKFWVFLSGLTNVGVTVTVTDTQTGMTKVYQNPVNTVFKTNLDTSAFATCN